MKWILLALALSVRAAPTWAQAVPVGSYDQGQLINAACLPGEGEGYMQLYRDVGRIWGTDPLVNMIVRTAADISARYPGKDRMQVEDISAKHGGDISGHASHENGLDVDVGYFKNDGVEHDPIRTGEMYAPPMVTGTKVSANFDLERNWEMMKSFHKHADVHKIFVDQHLKNALCRYARSTNDYAQNIQVLRSLRHVTNHQDHLHVRLNCPPAAKKCVSGPALPPGSGCP